MDSVYENKIWKSEKLAELKGLIIAKLDAANIELENEKIPSDIIKDIENLCSGNEFVVLPPNFDKEPNIIVKVLWLIKMVCVDDENFVKLVESLPDEKRKSLDEICENYKMAVNYHECLREFHRAWTNINIDEISPFLWEHIEKKFEMCMLNSMGTNIYIKRFWIECLFTFDIRKIATMITLKNHGHLYLYSLECEANHLDKILKESAPGWTQRMKTSTRRYYLPLEAYKLPEHELLMWLQIVSRNPKMKVMIPLLSPADRTFYYNKAILFGECNWPARNIKLTMANSNLKAILNHSCLKLYAFQSENRITVLIISKLKLLILRRSINL